MMLCFWCEEIRLRPPPPPPHILIFISSDILNILKRRLYVIVLLYLPSICKYAKLYTYVPIYMLWMYIYIYTSFYQNPCSVWDSIVRCCFHRRRRRRSRHHHHRRRCGVSLMMITSTLPPTQYQAFYFSLLTAVQDVVYDWISRVVSMVCYFFSIA